MYNYRIGNITDNDILEDVFNFCSDIHTEDELLQHVIKTLNTLFALHECSLFHTPKNLDDSIWNRILFEYNKCMERSNIVFPERLVVGPQYDYDSISATGLNMDRRLTKLVPYFFGISYTTEERTHGNGWKPSRNPENIMTEHRKLYDILFSYCYPNGNSGYLEKEKNNILGNFAKPSIFRFDDRAVGNYRKVIEHIRRELIYRISGSNSWEKLRDVMFVEQNASQMRSLAFSLIEQLMKSTKMMFDKKTYCDALYNRIIEKCKNSEIISIKEKGKKDKYVSPINMDINDDANAVLYYAYAFFCNLQTSDYIQEVKNLLDRSSADLDKIINLSTQYKANRRLLMLGDFYWKDKNGYIVDGLADIMRDYRDIPYGSIEIFIEKAWDAIIPIICIDDFENGKGAAFCKRHRGHMVGFIHLFKAIHHKAGEEYISVIYLVDLLHLYVRLKVCSVSIPTASNGYNKTNPTKPIKINNALKSLQEEWDLRASNEFVKDELYMKNVIIETWLSVVMYMAINEFDCSLFMKRLDATQRLFYVLLQRIPFITKKDDSNVDYERIINELLDIDEVREYIR